MTAREFLLFGFPLLLLAVPVYLKVKNSESELRKVMVSLAGPRAVDCNSKGEKSFSYLISTIKTGKTFIYSNPYEDPAGSGKYLFGRVRTPRGEMFCLCWQCAPWYSLSSGRLNWIARVKHLKFTSGNQGFSEDGGNILTPSEQERLLKSATKTS